MFQHHNISVFANRSVVNLVSCLLFLGGIQFGPIRCGTEVGNPLSSAPSDNAGPGGRSFPIEGMVYKGPVGNSEVLVYGFDGSAFTAAVEMFETEVDGTFSISLPNQALLLVATGGTYIDEARFPEVATLERLAAYVSELPKSSEDEYLMLTPLTTMAAARIDARLLNANAGLSMTDVETIIENENEALAEQYGLDGLGILVDSPFSIATGLEQSEIIAILLPAGLSFLSAEVGFASTDELLTLLADDYSDGTLDALNAAGDSIEQLDGLDFNAEWDAAINAYLHPDNKATLNSDGSWSGGTNFTGLSQSDWAEIKTDIPAFQ